MPELGRTVGEELLEPTRIYVRPIKNILQHYPVKQRVVRGLAHITGEGLEGNVPRVLPPGRRVFLRKRQLADAAGVRLAAAPRRHRRGGDGPRLQHGHRLRGDRRAAIYAESIQRQLQEDRVPTFVIGEVREGEPGVEFVTQ